MMDEDTLALNMILADEGRQSKKGKGGDKELTLIQKRGVTLSSQFRLKGEDFNGDAVNMPIEGKGALDSFVAVARNSENFALSVEVDNHDVVDREEYSELKRLSTELSKIGAYERGTDRVVSVSGYPFKERLNIILYPKETIEFDIVRAEIIKGTTDVEQSGGLDPETAKLLE